MWMVTPGIAQRVLSEDRANAVRAWLTGHGVAGDRLVAQGYGQNKPLVPNVTANNRARNRRVQFVILEGEGTKPRGKPDDKGKKQKLVIPIDF